jgi:hypothetical protein
VHDIVLVVGLLQEKGNTLAFATTRCVAIRTIASKAIATADKASRTLVEEVWDPKPRSFLIICVVLWA